MPRIVKPLPTYTKGEELCNAISHGVGALLALAALPILIVWAAFYGDVWSVVSCSVYGATLLLLYVMSTIYHALRIEKAKRIFQIIDHCSIFLLIAGTYTPYTLVTLRREGAWGWVLFGVVWAAAIGGIVLNAVDMHRFKVISMIFYLCMGWSVMVAFVPLIEVFSGPGLMLMIVGGVCYTVGAVLYGLGKKIRYMHAVWHLFVLAGSILHFFSILFYVLPNR